MLALERLLVTITGESDPKGPFLILWIIVWLLIALHYSKTLVTSLKSSC